MSLQDQLTRFREAFFSTKCNVEDDYITYKTRRGLGRSLAEQANELIEFLGLDLTAVPTSLTANDSFYVKSSEVEL